MRELRGVSVTDVERNKEKLRAELDGEMYEGGVMFVDIETDRGVLQFVAYNEHNGYYGHEARVSSTQVTHKEIL